MNHPYEMKITNEFNPQFGNLPNDPLARARLERDLSDYPSYYERRAVGAVTPSVRQDPETGEYYIGADVYSP